MKKTRGARIGSAKIVPGHAGFATLQRPRMTRIVSTTTAPVQALNRADSVRLGATGVGKTAASHADTATRAAAAEAV